MSNSTSSEQEHWNVYANTAEGQPIFIMAAVSGRNGYFCQGCKREMQAVLPHQERIRPYFRHDAYALKANPGNCTYSDETYRHKLSKEILVRLLKVKVPSVYKYPPKGLEGPAKKISSSKIISAHSAQVERDFYEDENGTLHWGRLKEPTERKSLIRPDVIFFDASGKPILFIELVAQHKVDYEKLIKLKSIGIDTIAISIPQDSPEKIEECFSNTTRTKWIYNYEQDRTDYLLLPNPAPGRIPPIDEVQRKLFTETFYCRKAEIGNLIRRLRECLESKQYSDLERQLREQLKFSEENERLERKERERIETAIDKEVLSGYLATGGRVEDGEEEIRKQKTKLDRIGGRLESRYRSIKTTIEAESYKEFAEPRNGIIETEKSIRELQRKIERVTKSLEKRYGRIKEEIGRDEAVIRNGIKEQLSDAGITGATLADRQREIEGEARTVEQSIEREIRSTTEIYKRTAELPVRFQKEEADYRERVSQLETDERTKGEELSNLEAQEPTRFEDDRRELERKSNEAKGRILAAIQRRDPEGDPMVSGEIKAILFTGKLFADYATLYKSYERNTKALRNIDTEAFKAWAKTRRDI